jgi:hypothetical protein
MSRPLTSSERQRLRTPANLWRALIPLLAVVGLLVVLVWPRPTHSDGVIVVDVAGPIAAARQQAGFTVLAPSGLSNRWRPTHTDLVPPSSAAAAGFTIGYVSPSGKYAEFHESADAPDAVAAGYGPLTADGTASVAGAAWDQFRTDRDRQLLRRTVGRVTVIVTGSAPPAELAELAGSVR